MAQTCWEVRFNSIFNSILIRFNDRHICEQHWDAATMLAFLQKQSGPGGAVVTQRL